MGIHLHLFLALLLVLMAKETSSTHCTVSHRTAYQTYRTICTRRCWWHCCDHTTVQDTHYRASNKQMCCPGWMGANCNTAVCNPACANGGTCTAPNTCNCRTGYHGATCGGLSCNYERPCFPGVCQDSGSSVKCTCQSGFEGQYCKTLTQVQVPQITLTRARMSFWRRGDNSNKEMYGLLVDASSANGSTMWTNLPKFNMLNMTAAAMFNGASLLPFPSFIKAADTGIVSAEFHLQQVKKDIHGGTDVVNLNEDLPCTEETIDRQHPRSLVNCFVDKDNFDRSLENGDRLTITFKVSSGGYRLLYDSGSHTTKETEYFLGHLVEKSVAFYFDFDMPAYQSPDQAFHLSPEFTKTPITMRWEGWTDADSGMYRYTWEAFKLEPNGDGDLREVDPLRPVIHQQFKHTTPMSYPLPYAPGEPGMYSFILEAVDKANNSVYMRRFALYDKESEVTTDLNHALNISSAQHETWFSWITNVPNNVVVNWENHFLNYVHENGKFLNRILPFNVRIVDDPPIFKSVANKSDDHEGRRTTAAIPNLRGIVRFQWTIAINKTGGDIKQAPPNWHDAGLSTSLQLNLTKDNVTSGSTLTVWIKARDILDNTKVDSKSVTCDFTPPLFKNMIFHRNQQSNIPFSSRLELTVLDKESGLGHVEIKVTQKSNGASLTNKTIPMSSIPMSGCTDRVTKCYCPNSLDVCYNRVSTVDISNCWLMVSKASLQTAAVDLEVYVVNRAGLRTFKVLQLTNLTSLNGTEAYFGPMGVNTEEISDSSVRVTWHHSPSCYPRTFIWINYEWDTGHSDMIKVYKDANYYDLTDLDPSRAYTVNVTTDYGGIKSKPVAVSFKTLDAPAQPGIGTGAIAGIAVGALLIVVVLGVGIFVWKTGKAAAMMKRRRSRYTTRRTYQEHPRGKLNNAEAKVKSYKNNAYNVDDDIYLYGSMEFGLEQPWYISKDNLKLQQELQVGKFARILKATYKHGAKSTEVVAKLLKDEVNDASRLMMLAKINFAATQVGEHRNVLKFIGAVVNNDALGPVMVLEICRKGQLDKWLSSHQNKINDEIMEKVNLFALGVARGMAYLADKGIVHRKLGARNCLLTSSDEVKVTGFGPCKLEEDGEDNNAKSDKIPVKWTAPECLQSLKEANEKSDIWSFGITMWEIFSMGKTPYDGVRSRDLPTKIRNGHRLKKPEFAEDVHYELMQTCWKSSPQARPTFAEMLGKLQALFGLTPSSDETYYYAS